MLFSRLSDGFLFLLPSSWLLHYTLRFEPAGGSVVASQKIMRLGVMRINAGLLLGAMDCPPSGRAWACPRISRLLVFHGGSTSSINKDARPLRLQICQLFFGKLAHTAPYNFPVGNMFTLLFLRRNKNVFTSSGRVSHLFVRIISSL